MHALSRDTEFYKKACIYCQLDEPEELAAASEEDMVCSHEIMLVPEDESAGATAAAVRLCMPIGRAALNHAFSHHSGSSMPCAHTSSALAVDAIFESLCEGAEANPDAMDGDEGEFFFDQAEVAAGLDEDAQQRLVELEDRLQLPTAEQFEEMVAADGPDHLDGSIEQSAGAGNGAIERADQVQHDPS